MLTTVLAAVPGAAGALLVVLFARAVAQRSAAHPALSGSLVTAVAGCAVTVATAELRALLRSSSCVGPPLAVRDRLSRRLGHGAGTALPGIVGAAAALPVAAALRTTRSARWLLGPAAGAFPRELPVAAVATLLLTVPLAAGVVAALYPWTAVLRDRTGRPTPRRRTRVASVVAPAAWARAAVKWPTVRRRDRAAVRPAAHGPGRATRSTVSGGPVGDGARDRGGRAPSLGSVRTVARAVGVRTSEADGAPLRSTGTAGTPRRGTGADGTPHRRRRPGTGPRGVARVLRALALLGVGPGLVLLTPPPALRTGRFRFHVSLPAGRAAGSTRLDAVPSIGWLLVLVGAAAAGTALLRLAGRALAGPRAGAAGLIAGSAVHGAAGRLGRPLGLLACLAGAWAASGPRTPPGPGQGGGDLLLGCAAATAAWCLTAAFTGAVVRTRAGHRPLGAELYRAGLPPGPLRRRTAGALTVAAVCLASAAWSAALAVAAVDGHGPALPRLLPAAALTVLLVLAAVLGGDRLTARPGGDRNA